MTSHRQIFRSSAIIGGASAINIVIGIIKVKVLAVLLGPAGIGLMGLYQNIMSMASTLAGCGVGGSGVRQLAASADEASTLAIVRRALWLSNLILGLVGMLVLWSLRDPVSQWVFGDASHANEIGWLGLGVLLTLVAGSQTALLQGLRRIGDLARVRIVSAFFGAATGILVVYWLGEGGVLWFVLTAPAVSILVASYYANRLPRPQTPNDWQAIRKQWQAMLALGIPMMTAVLFTLTTQLAARAIILRELGLDAVGYFQAAWAISMTYIGFVLGAMGTDYYPRLTAAITDRALAKRMVNEQSEMALLLAGPVMLAMITFAPLVIHILYAPSFAPATDVLRWQVLGDVLKASSWPMGFILLALGRGGIYVGTEVTWGVVYLGTMILGIEKWGLLIAGVGFWIAYLLYYLLLAVVTFSLIGFKQSRRNWLSTLMLLFAGAVIMLAAAQSSGTGYVVGIVVMLVMSFYSLHQIDKLMNLRGWLRQRFNK